MWRSLAAGATAILGATGNFVLPRTRGSLNSGARRVTGEDEVATFGRLVAREAGLVQRLVTGFAVLEVGKSPAASRGVILRVLHHELNILGRPRNGRLQAGARKADRQDLVVVARRGLIPMQCGNDCAIREWELPVAEGLYRNVVAQLGAQLFQVAARQLVERDQAP